MTALSLRRLNNGQLFCSCLSADFVQALVLFAQHPLDVVFVETSGMANPLPLKELLAEMEKRTGHHYDYQGMTALVDPESFLDLAEVVNASRNRSSAASVYIINKVDLASPETVRRVREKSKRLTRQPRSLKQVMRRWSVLGTCAASAIHRDVRSTAYQRSLWKAGPSYHQDEGRA